MHIIKKNMKVLYFFSMVATKFKGILFDAVVLFHDDNVVA